MPVEEFVSDVKYAMSTLEVMDFPKFRYLLFKKFKSHACSQIHPKRSEYVSVQEILEELISLYSHKKGTLTLEVELADMAQGTESISDYTARIKRITEQLHQRVISEHRSALVIAELQSKNRRNALKRFTKGLKENLADVWRKEPASLEEAMAYTKEAEEIFIDREKVRSSNIEENMWNVNGTTKKTMSWAD